MRRLLAGLAFMLACGIAAAQKVEVVDLPTRAGVTVRMLVQEPAAASSVVVLLTGGNGSVDIAPDGSMRRGGNFLVRSRGLFADRGHAVVVPDAPSDRGAPHYMGGVFRDSPAHAADLAAVVAWARTRYGKPVWLVGTSRGTHSAATAALQLKAPAAPDGIVLTSTILAPSDESPATPLTELDLTGVALPVLVVHHEQDPCRVCPPALLPELMKRLPAGTPLHTFTGGQSRGAPCDPFSHHGFNGIEDRVVEDISAWIRSRP